LCVWRLRGACSGFPEPDDPDDRPGGAGGPTDILGRLMGDFLSQRFGQPVVIDNRPGAGTNIGTQAVINAEPDGYTLLVTTHANAINARSSAICSSISSSRSIRSPASPRCQLRGR